MPVDPDDRDVVGNPQAELAASDPNTLMAGLGAQMAAMNASELVTRTIEESAAVLDVVGFNYADSRYALDAELFPNRVIVGSETFPERIGALWPLVSSLPPKTPGPAATARSRACCTTRPSRRPPGRWRARRAERGRARLCGAGGAPGRVM